MLIVIAVAIAAVAMFPSWRALGVAYLLICGLALATILYTYCARCSCRAHCGHVLPGRLVMAIGQREPGPYTRVNWSLWAWRYSC